jgi:hypothetical protein
MTKESCATLRRSINDLERPLEAHLLRQSASPHHPTTSRVSGIPQWFDQPLTERYG